MSLGRRAAIRALAFAMKAGAPPAELRAGLDKAYSGKSDEWRRDVWREAAERAAASA